VGRLRALVGDKFSQDLTWNIGSLGIAGVAGIAVNYAIGATYGAATLGVFNQVFAIYLVCSQLAALGVHSSVLTHFAAERDPMQRRAQLLAGLALTGSQSLVIALAMAAIARPIAHMLDSPDVTTGILYATPGLVCFALNKVVLAALNALHRMRWYAVFQACRILFVAAGFFVCWGLHVHGAALPVILTTSELVTLVLALRTVRDQLGRAPRPELRRWAGIHLRFGLRGVLSGLFSDLGTRIDVLILGVFATDATVGAYSMAALVAEGMYQALVALRAIYAPHVVVMIAGDQRAELERRIHKGRNRTYLAALAIGAVAVAAYALLIPYVTHDPQIRDSWKYFAIMVAGMVAGAGYVPFSQILLWAKRPGWHTILIAIVLASVSLLEWLLVPQLGAIGAAIGNGATYVITAIVLRVMVGSVLRVGL
jgi:O-antigen/teichoic acid export membrane protein